MKNKAIYRRMITGKRFAALAILLFMLASCQQAYDCPGVPEEDREWLPYQVGDSIRMPLGDDLLMMMVNTVFITEAQTFSKDWGYDCTPTMLVNAGVDSSMLISLAATISYTSSDLNLGYLPLHVRITTYERDHIDLMPVAEDDFYCEPNGSNWTLEADRLTITNSEPENFTQIELLKGLGFDGLIKK